MERYAPSTTIYCGTSNIPNAGRGVFAAVDVRGGEVIERCPVIELMEKDARARLHETSLRNYYFIWGEKRDRGAICLGLGSIYNHSYKPNARYLKLIAEKRIDFVAIRDIGRDEEITVNYNGDPADQSPLWSGAMPGSGTIGR